MGHVRDTDAGGLGMVARPEMKDSKRRATAVPSPFRAPDPLTDS